MVFPKSRSRYLKSKSISLKKESFSLKKWTPLLIFLSLFAILVLAAEGDEIVSGWNKTFNSNLTGYDSLTIATDEAYDITADSSGNIFVAGYGAGLENQWNSGSSDWWIKKFNAAGTSQLWDIYIDGGFNASEQVNAIDTDSAGNLYAVGNWVNSSGAVSRWNIKRYNSSGEGNNTWNISFYDSSSSSTARDVVVDSTDNVWVIGDGYSINNTYTGSQGDWHLEKYNTNGVKTWDYNHTSVNTSQDVAYAAALDGNNNLYVAGTEGYLFGEPPFDNFGLLTGGSKEDWRVLKFTNTGNINSTWNVSYSSDSNSSDYAYDIALDSTGNIIVVGSAVAIVNQTPGQFGLLGSGDDWLVRKYTSAGTLLWSFNYSLQLQNAADVAYSVVVDNSDNIYVGGYTTNSTGYVSWHIKKLDSNGIEDNTWNKTVQNPQLAGSGPNAYAYSLLLNSTNLYVVGSGTNLSADPTSGTDWWIKKYTATTAVEVVTNWNKNFTGNRSGLSTLTVPSDYAYGLSADSSGNIFVVGDGMGLIGGDELSAKTDWWIKKFTSAGTEDTTNWNIYLDGGINLSDTPYSLDFDSLGNLYVVGVWTNDTTDGGAGRFHLERFNTSGNRNMTWSSSYYESSNSGGSKAYDVAVDSTNNVWAIGYGTALNASYSQKDWHLERYATTGIKNWDVNYSSHYNGSDVAYGIALDATGNAYVAGSSVHLFNAPFDFFGIPSGGSGIDWLVRKYSNAGVYNSSWSVSYDSSRNATDNAYDIAVDSEGSVVVVGSGFALANTSLDGTGQGSGTDWLIRKYDSSGALLWSINYSYVVQSAYTDEAFAVAIDNNKSIYVGGDFANLTGSYWHVKKFNGSGVEDSDWNKTIVPYEDAATHTLRTLLLNETSLYLGGARYRVSTSFDWGIKKYNTSAVAASVDIPEFSDYAILVILVSVVGGFFYMKRHEEKE
ncbi:hypothetical protein HYV86_05030 [Candidatus Woesearchaeota archaeon]|nr:hypothetical protein [Candidatus Woesearchaeota archaeon]